MDHDTFIMTVCGLVEEHYRLLTAPCPIRHGSFVPQLSDGAAITMVLGSAFVKSSCATALRAYYQAHSLAFCPPHGSYAWCAAHRQPLAMPSPSPASFGPRELPCPSPWLGLDNLPLPVRPYTRAGRRDYCLPEKAD